jgi:hypothetical protein
MKKNFGNNNFIPINLSLTLGMHALWELNQRKFFYDNNDISFSVKKSKCILCSFGDLFIASASYGFAALFVKNKRWILNSKWAVGGAVAMTTGLALTVLIEKMALKTKRWNYSPEMPKVYGVGISPILQWIAIPLITITLNRKFASQINIF